LGEFRPKNYTVSRNFAKNYKSQQNMANPNMSRIFGSGEFIFFQQFGYEVLM